MFNVKHWVEGVLTWLGERISEQGEEQLRAYGTWLAEEAIPAGGLGPQERDRIEERHIADSLSFAKGLAPEVESVLDIGSGVGLPGIPLAVLRPGSHFILLDRSAKRCDLAARSVLVLGLTNVSVECRAVEAWSHKHDAIVMRASLRPSAAFPLVRRLLRPHGAAIVGLSRETESPSVSALAASAANQGLRVDVIGVPVLDSPTSLLRIVRNDEIS